MLLSYKWDGYGLGSLCGAIVRASLRDAKNNIRMKGGKIGKFFKTEVKKYK